MFALLGPNGAGKTTTIHILSTLIAADAGEVSVAGFDVAREPDAVRGLIGVTGQVSAVDGQFTGEENLRLMADLYHLGKEEGRRKVAELLERFDLVDDAAKPAMTYSGGMRRRLDLAMTLVGDPRIIFLDEPTTGLDPRSRRVMWDIVRELVADGVTILLTTQYLEEADRLASRIALLDGGRIVAAGHAGELKRLVPGGSVRLEFADEAELDRAAASLGDGTRDDQGLALDLPSDGGVHSRAHAARPARRRVHRGRRPVREVRRPRRRVPVPDRPPRGAEEVPAHDRLSRHRLGDDAPPQPAPDAPLPVADVLHRRHPRRLAAAVRRSCSAGRWGRGSAARRLRAAATPTSPTSCRGSC